MANQTVPREAAVWSRYGDFQVHGGRPVASGGSQTGGSEGEGLISVWDLVEGSRGTRRLGPRSCVVCVRLVPVFWLCFVFCVLCVLALLGRVCVLCFCVLAMLGGSVFCVFVFWRRRPQNFHLDTTLRGMLTLAVTHSDSTQVLLLTLRVRSRLVRLPRGYRRPSRTSGPRWLAAPWPVW